MAFSAAVTCGCSPIARLQIRFLFPPLVGSGASTLIVTGVKVCPPGPLGALSPSRNAGDAFLVEQEQERSAAIVTASFRGGSCSARLTAWLDVNADGKIGPPDLVGSSATAEIRDRGLIRGNLTRGPDVPLAPVL